jgi:hypothetical protein
VVEIIDNFLDQNEFDALEKVMMYPHIPWHYQDRIDTKDEDGTTFQFIHLFFQIPQGQSSEFMSVLDPTIGKIDPLSLYRIKANLLTRTPNIVVNTMHQDMLGMSNRVKGQWTTSILYLNTNNGYTEFKDGTTVESVANRLVSFPANTWHRGTSCTDQNIRVIINFNYFAYEHDPDFVADDRTQY